MSLTTTRLATKTTPTLFALGLIGSLLSTPNVWAASPPADGVPFNGRTSYAVAEDGQAFNADQLTVSTWVKFNHTGDAQILLNRGAANELFTLYLFDGRIRMLVRHTPETYLHANVAAPPENTWVHYTGTYDGHKIKLYVDGQLKATTAAEGQLAKSSAELYLGAAAPGVRTLDGVLEDARIWRRVLTAEEVAQVAESNAAGALADDLAARWTAASLSGETWQSQAVPAIAAAYFANPKFTQSKADGYHGIWYANQNQGGEYVYKYSGGLGTYCAKHRPLAIYAPEVDKTFFCYGGTDKDQKTLLHMVSYYDHKTGMVPRPTILLDKHTNDAHDNPVISIDAKGYIWIFSSSHGTARPSYISVSTEPYSVDSFERVLTTNFSYTQPFYLKGKGFFFPHTVYAGGRAIYQTSSPDGRNWSEPQLVSLIAQGHYQVCEPFNNQKVGSAYNYHPKGKGLNWRTNLYYMETDDFGHTWKNVKGETLSLPLTEVQNPALVAEYESKNRNAYMKDLTFDKQGNPIILYVTSGGWEAGPKNDPRIWQTARWTGTEWDIQGSIQSDNNYDTGSLYVEDDGTWRLIGPSETGPQPYNPGGEIAMWLSKDQGHSWKMVKQLTHDSKYNHTYARRPINAHPDFYAIWADGHARQPSDSRIYFTNRNGDHVWRLPVKMDGDFAKPEIAW